MGICLNSPECYPVINETQHKNAFRYDTLVKNDFEHILATEENK